MGAFFILSFLSFNTALAEDSCELSTSSRSVAAIVKWVYDGDTLLVTDTSGNNKRKIRIIGIDTPEVKHHQQKAQMYGAKAREELRVLIKQHNYQILLELDKEKYDRYDRELAYTYFPDGKSISEWLLRRGYAKTLIIPPNVKYADCYRNAEQDAQQKKLKLWKLKANQLKSVSDLKSRSKGYIRLKGKITKYRQTKKTIILEIESKWENPIQVKIRKKNLRYFKKFDLAKLPNQEVIVSGKLKNKKGKRSIYLNHASQLEISSTKTVSKIKTIPTLKWSLEK